MYNYNQHLHFIGIGGVGMAGIAEILLNLGYSVSGSDLKQSPLTDHLMSAGAKITFGHRPENMPRNTTVVVVSSAIKPDNAELEEASRRALPVIPRAEMLAELMRMKYGVAVAGSHGKTTTTSMIAKILSDAELDPTVIIGGRVLLQNSGASLGTGQYLVAETDESDGSFCLLRPAIAVVTNIDSEHLSHYGSFGELERAFLSFMSSVPFYGLVVACFDDPVVRKLAGNLKRRVVSYGLSPEHEIHASNIVVEGKSSSFDLSVFGEKLGRVNIGMPGHHMVKNALAALAVGIEVGADIKRATLSLQDFPGVARRSEIVGEERGVLVIDDYAHHPTEIISTLAAIRAAWVSQRKGRLITLFQPHRYSRTRELFTMFVEAFGDADELIVGEIYPAGEEELPGISGQILASAIRHSHVTFVKDLNDSLPELSRTLSSGDVVLTLGAGSIGQVAHALVERLKA